MQTGKQRAWPWRLGVVAGRTPEGGADGADAGRPVPGRAQHCSGLVCGFPSPPQRHCRGKPLPVTRQRGTAQALANTAPVLFIYFRSAPYWLTLFVYFLFIICVPTLGSSEGRSRSVMFVAVSLAQSSIQLASAACLWNEFKYECFTVNFGFYSVDQWLSILLFS